MARVVLSLDGNFSFDSISISRHNAVHFYIILIKKFPLHFNNTMRIIQCSFYSYHHSTNYYDVY